MSTKRASGPLPDSGICLLLAADLGRHGEPATALASQLSRIGIAVTCCDARDADPLSFMRRIDEQRGHAPAIIAAGYGIGSLAALAAAQEQPESIAGLLLLEPDLVPPPDRSPVLGSLLGGIAAHAPLLADRAATTNGAWAGLASHVTMRLAEVRKPTLIVLGDAPAASTRRTAERLQWQIGGSVDLIAGHSLTAAPVVPEFIRNFAARCADAAGFGPEAAARPLRIAAAE